MNQSADNSLFYVLHDATRQIRKHFDRRATRLELTRAQWRALKATGRHEGLSQTELADYLDMEPIPVGRVIDRLEKTGFVERRADPGDRRRWRLYLTPKAHAVVDEMEVIADELRDDALRGIPRADLDALMRTLTQMKENLAALDAAANEEKDSVMTEKQIQVQDAAVAKAAPKRKWTRRLLWIGGPAVVLAIAGWLYVSSGRFASTDNAYVQADRVTIAPQISGRVAEVDVRENQPVKKGDVLFRIDSQPLEIAFARMQAQVDTVKSLLDAARSGYRSAQADVRSSAADLKYKEQQFKRMQELRGRGLVAQQALDDAANNLAAARAKQDSNNAAVNKAQNLLGGLPETPDEQLAGYKLALAQMAQAKLDLEHAVVRAPIDGVIGKTALQPGDFLATGQAAMPLVANTLWVDANFKETDLTHVAAGQDASIEVDTFPGKKWQARVASISPASGAEFSVLPAQNATGNWVKIVQRIPVRLAIEEPNHDGMILRAGMSAVVEIDTGKQNSILGRWQGGAEPAARVAQSR